MLSFSPPRDRDAWSTIRGFVYQVDLTIERWLELSPTQTLELERGEDIDIVSRSLMASTEAEQQRLLEQVKHREQSVTLRSPSVIEFIACAIEHRHANPDLDLLFRYTTNAPIGLERSSPLPNRTPAIFAWQQTCQGNLTGDERTNALEGIRTILRDVQQPQNLPVDTWTIFQDFVNSTNDNEFLELVNNLDWSTNASSTQELAPHIQNLLINQQYARDTQQAEEQYQRLFLYVFKLLSQPGIKRLTVEDRATQLSLPPLSEQDRELLDSVIVRICRLEARVDVVELSLLQLNSQVQRLAQDKGIDAAIDYTVATPILDVPPSVEHLSRREKVINELKTILGNHTWIAVYGSTGSGKTQLAVLLAHALGNCRMWIRLRNLTIEQACVRLDAACESIAGVPSQSNRYEWYRQFCERLGNNVLLVLDDLPRLSDGDELSERLRHLAMACRLYDIRLLSTSPYPLPSQFRTSLGDEVLHSLEIPPFDNYETAEVLAAHGMPDSLLQSKLVSLVNTVGKQHPSLIVAITRYLKQKNWPPLEDAVGDLFKGEHAVEINDETVAKILSTIEDVQSRELLYRLGLIIGDFSVDDVYAIAAIDPVIERPREQLHNLMGLWIQRDANTRLLISPLVSSIGSYDLSSETSKACHLELGTRIVRKGKIDPFDILQAMVHLSHAEAFDLAGTLLILFFSEIYKLDGPVEDWGLLSFWADRPLPDQMDLGIRLCLRGLQIGVMYKFGRETSFLIEDLTSLVEQASGNETWALVSVLVYANQAITRNKPQLANHLYLDAVRLVPDMRRPDGGEFIIPENLHLEQLIWPNAVGITTADHLRDWINTVDQLTPEQRERAFTNKLAEAGCLEVVDKLWLIEADKPKDIQQWDTVLDALKELAERSQQLNLELLWACAIRAQVIVLAEYYQDPDTAVLTAETALSLASLDPRVQFLIKECVGRQYVYANQNEKALIWLEQGLDQTSIKETYPLQYMHTLLSASRAIGSQDPYAAVDYAQQAVTLVKISKNIAETVLVKALSELAIAHWLAGDLSAAFEALDEAGERLHNFEPKTDAWKDIFVLFSHLAGYLSALARDGQPPSETWNGEPYGEPRRAMFFTHNPARALLYDETRKNFVLANLAMFAKSMGQDNRADAWTLRGIDAAQESNQRTMFAKLSLDLIPHLLKENRFEEAVSIAVDASRILIVLGEQIKAGKSPFAPDFDLDELLDSIPQELVTRAEYNAVEVGLVPIAFRISTIAIDEFIQAQSYAAQLASLCRQISTTAADQQLWTIAAELFEQIYLRDTSGKEIIHYSNTIDADKYHALRVIGYIGAALQEGVSLKNALWADFHTLPFVYNLLKPPSATYRRIILPFVVKYWQSKFEGSRFRFSSPRLVEKGLVEAQKKSDTQRAQSILKTIAFGLDIKPPPEIKEWLNLT